MTPNLSKPAIAVGLGEILWDLLPGGKQLGGAPANFAYHAGVVGARAEVVSAVGDNPLGHEIRTRLKSLAVGHDLVVTDPAHPTGTVDVRLDAAGVPEYVIHENVAWDFIPSSEPLLKLAAGCDVVCFGTLGQRSAVSRQTIHQFLAATRPDCLRVFDINLRQAYFTPQIVTESLRLATIFKLNDQEVPVVADLLGLDGPETAVADALLRRYPLQVVAVTRGGSGSSLYTPSARLDHPGCPTQIVDTVGAGDAFTAALAIGWLHGEDPTVVHDRANRLASFVCSQPGATPSVPPEVLA